MSESVDEFLAEKMGILDPATPSPSTDPVAYLKMTDWFFADYEQARDFLNKLYWIIIEQSDAERKQIYPDEIRVRMHQLILSPERGSEAVAIFLGWRKE